MTVSRTFSAAKRVVVTPAVCQGLHWRRVVNENGNVAIVNDSNVIIFVVTVILAHGRGLLDNSAVGGDTSEVFVVMLTITTIVVTYKWSLAQ